MRTRPGFTLAELLVVVVLGGIVLTSIYSVLTTQERSIRQSYAIVSTQQNVRTAIQVISSDLREVSATDGDVTVADSITLGYRALRKAGVICNSDELAGTWMDVAVLGDEFARGDSLLIYADGPNAASAADDAWIRNMVGAVNSSGTCAGNPIAANVQRVSLGTVAASTIRPGGLVRSFTPILYRLDNVGSEGQLRRGEGSDTISIIEELSTVANQGLRFRYWDTARVALTAANLTTQARRNTIGRIQVKVRGFAVGGGLRSGREFSDSLVYDIYLRGNRKLR